LQAHIRRSRDNRSRSSAEMFSEDSRRSEGPSHGPMEAASWCSDRHKRRSRHTAMYKHSSLFLTVRELQNGGLPPPALTLLHSSGFECQLQARALFSLPPHISF